MIFISQKRYNVIGLFTGKNCFYVGILEKGKSIDKTRFTNKTEKEFGQSQAASLFRKKNLKTELTYQEAVDYLEFLSVALVQVGIYPQVDPGIDKQYMNSEEYDRPLQLSSSVRAVLSLETNPLESIEDFKRFAYHLLVSPSIDSVEDKYVYDILSKVIEFAQQMDCSAFEDVQDVPNNLQDKLNKVYENL